VGGDPTRAALSAAPGSGRPVDGGAGLVAAASSSSQSGASAGSFDAAARTGPGEAPPGGRRGAADAGIDAGDPSSFTGALAQLQGQAPNTGLVAPGMSPEAVLQASVATPVDDPGFGNAVMRRVSDLAGQGVQQATLDLNPAEMGPIRIHLALHGVQARIDFRAAHEHTRGLLEAALPALAAALQDDGLRLAHASVAGLADPAALGDPAGAAGPAPGDPGGAMGQGGGGAGREAGAGGASRTALAAAAALGVERAQRLAGQGWGEAAAGGRRAGAAGSAGLDLYA
jgi:flagellar hook-length control protein FliK